MNNIYDFIKQKISCVKKPIVLEIGACDGKDTERILNIIGNSRYYAFEPDPRNFKCLAKKKLPIYAFELAISDSIGEFNFHLSSGKKDQASIENTRSNSLLKPKRHLTLHPWCKFNEIIKVQTITLDYFNSLLAFDYINFIWCDIQGAESLMIKGAQKVLKKTKYLYMEFHKEEMYHGEVTDIEKIFELLPGDWELIKRFTDDILVENHGFNLS